MTQANAGVSVPINFYADPRALSNLQRTLASRNININAKLQDNGDVDRISAKLKALNGSKISFSMDIKNPASIQQLNTILNQFNRLQSSSAAVTTALTKQGNAARKAGEDVLSFGQAMGFSTNRLVRYLIPATTIFLLSKAFREAKDVIVEVNADINKLSQILDGNTTKSRKVAEEVLNVASKYGTSVKDIFKVTNALAQAGDAFSGDNLTKTVEAIAKTPLLATFGSLEETTKGVITALSQFNLTGNETARVLDVANELSKKFAVESKDLLEAFQAGGKSFQLKGGTFEEFMAFVSAAKQLTGLSSSTIGTGFNTIFERLFRPESIRFLDELTGGKIRDAKGNIKDITSILLEAGKAFGTLSKEQKSFVVNQLAGDRQGKLLAPILDSASRGKDGVVAKNLEALKHTFGSVNKDAEIGLQRLDTLLQKLETEFHKVFVGFSQNKDFVDFIGSVTKGMISMLEVTQKLSPAIVPLFKVLTGALAVKAFTILPQYLQGLGISSPGRLVDAARRGNLPESLTRRGAFLAGGLRTSLFREGFEANLDEAKQRRLSLFQSTGFLRGSLPDFIDAQRTAIDHRNAQSGIRIEDVAGVLRGKIAKNKILAPFIGSGLNDLSGLGFVEKFNSLISNPSTLGLSHLFLSGVIKKPSDITNEGVSVLNQALTSGASVSKRTSGIRTKNAQVGVDSSARATQALINNIIVQQRDLETFSPQEIASAEKDLDIFNRGVITRQKRLASLPGLKRNRQLRDLGRGAIRFGTAALPFAIPALSEGIGRRFTDESEVNLGSGATAESIIRQSEDNRRQRIFGSALTGFSTGATFGAALGGGIPGVLVGGTIGGIGGALNEFITGTKGATEALLKFASTADSFDEFARRFKDIDLITEESKFVATGTSAGVGAPGGHFVSIKRNKTLEEALNTPGFDSSLNSTRQFVQRSFRERIIKGETINQITASVQKDIEDKVGKDKASLLIQGLNGSSSFKKTNASIIGKEGLTGSNIELKHSIDAQRAYEDSIKKTTEQVTRAIDVIDAYNRSLQKQSFGLDDQLSKIQNLGGGRGLSQGAIGNILQSFEDSVRTGAGASKISSSALGLLPNNIVQDLSSFGDVAKRVESFSKVLLPSFESGGRFENKLNTPEFEHFAKGKLDEALGGTKGPLAELVKSNLGKILENDRESGLRGKGLKPFVDTLLGGKNDIELKAREALGIALQNLNKKVEVVNETYGKQKSIMDQFNEILSTKINNKISGIGLQESLGLSKEGAAAQSLSILGSLSPVNLKAGALINATNKVNSFSDQDKVKNEEAYLEAVAQKNRLENIANQELGKLNIALVATQNAFGKMVAVIADEERKLQTKGSLSINDVFKTQIGLGINNQLGFGKFNGIDNLGQASQKFSKAELTSQANNLANLPDEIFQRIIESLKNIGQDDQANLLTQLRGAGRSSFFGGNTSDAISGILDKISKAEELRKNVENLQNQQVQYLSDIARNTAGMFTALTGVAVPTASSPNSATKAINALPRNITTTGDTSKEVDRAVSAIQELKTTLEGLGSAIIEVNGQIEFTGIDNIKEASIAKNAVAGLINTLLDTFDGSSPAEADIKAKLLKAKAIMESEGD